LTARLLTVLAVLAALCAGIWIGGHPEKLPGPLQDVFVDDNVTLQAEATETIQDNFYRRVSDKELANGSIRGMVRSLHSRFSDYFTPKQNKLFNEAIDASYAGTGMTVNEDKRGLVVTGVYPGSPGKKAGIKPGDLITHVDGKSIAGESSTVSTARIKGPPGTVVTLTVRDGKTRDVKVKRATIKVPVVTGRLRTVNGKRLGVIGIASFSSDVSGPVRDQVVKLTKRGAQGFVLDLRADAGGLVDEAVLVSSVFIPSGKIVTLKGRTTPTKVYKAVGKSLTKAPVVVLVDRGTASASEIVTAALQQRLGAKVVGRRTFGKGVFGQVFPLSNGGALDLVLGNYYTPNGDNLNETGIKPNVPLSKRVSNNPPLALDRALQVLAGEVQSKQ
jgi:carboxyl-terminal processing protease